MTRLTPSDSSGTRKARAKEDREASLRLTCPTAVILKLRLANAFVSSTTAADATIRTKTAVREESMFVG